MNPTVIIERHYECVSQYHQDWNCTGTRIVGIFTDQAMLDLALLRQPKSWRDEHPYDDKRFTHYAEEGDTSVEWDITDDLEANRLYLTDND